LIGVAVVLALTAAALHGTWNVLVKVSGDPLAMFARASVASAAVATIVLVPELIFLQRPALNAQTAGICLLSATLETAYLWLLSTAYRRGELSAAYPIARGSAPLVAVAVGLLVLGEKLAPVQFAGVALLLAGIAAVTISQSGGRATVPALLTGVTIAAYTSVDRVGVRMTTPWLYGWLLFTLMAIELSVSLWMARSLRAMPRVEAPSWSRAAVIGAFMWLGYFLVLWALSIAPLAVVAPVRETSVVAVALWGVWRLRERDRSALKLSGALATLAGVALLAV
jgi:drug/metabolite transporter (DMT)-like permease